MADPDITSRTEPPQPSPAVSPWRPWLVFALAVVCTLAAAVYFEFTVRHDVFDAIRVEPADWSDPQVRLFATARSVISLPRREKLLREVVAMKPSGLVTAAAAGELGLTEPNESKRLNYDLLAAKAAPDDSPLLSAYCITASRELEKNGQAEQAEALLVQGIGRTPTLKAKSVQLSWLLNMRQRHGGLSATLQLYARYNREMPAVAHSDKVQETLADVLDKENRSGDATRILEYLAGHATNSFIRERAQRRLSGEPTSGHGH